MLKLVGCICASASNWCASSWVVITCQLANVEMMRLTSTWVRWASSLPCSLRLSTFGCRLSALSLHRSEEHTSELQSHLNLVCRLLLEKKKHKIITQTRLHTKSTTHYDAH